MRRLLGWIGVFAGGAAGWWLGALWNDIAAVLLSALGSGAGLYWGRRLCDALLA